MESFTEYRKDYISWDEYFMGIALLSAERSKDPNTQVGACIVKNNKIIAIGYNGFPLGCSDDSLPWKRTFEENETINDTKYPYVCHAELNAICNKNKESLKNSTLYVTLFPCNECAKLILQHQIKNIIYIKNKDDLGAQASKRMFDLAKVMYKQYKSNRYRNKIVLNYEDKL